MHISLDGFVAGSNGEMDWINVEDEIFEEANKEVDYDKEDGLFCGHTFVIISKIVTSMKHISIIIPEGHSTV